MTQAMIETLVKTAAANELLENGFVVIPRGVNPAEARAFRTLYDDEPLFRSRIVMERHSFGKGEYKYFAHPLPARLQVLREQLYRELVPVANEWMLRLGRSAEFPAAHQDFLHE